MQRYIKHFDIRYLETNQYKEATPVAMINFMQEAALAHSEAVGLGIDGLKARGVAWILNRWALEMESYPALNEKVLVETWPSFLDRFYSTREFLIKSPDGRLYGRGTSRWIYYSMEKRRPIKVPAHYGELYGLDAEVALENNFGDLLVPEDLALENEFTVRRSDIDTNHHVNNARYVEWVLEAVPQDVYDGYHLSFLEIAYKKEISHGTVRCYSGAGNPAGPAEWTGRHKITDREGTELAAAVTAWKKRTLSSGLIPEG